MFMHFFLTGALQVGKSTLVQKVMQSVSVPLGGFRTFFPDGMRNMPEKALHLTDVLQETPMDDQIVVRFTAQGPAADAARFDALGGRLLREARERAGVIIMDECGRLERDALVFQTEVMRALDGKTPVLGVVRQDAGGWTEGIRGHPNVCVITVTAENRDALLAPLTRYFAGRDLSAGEELVRHAHHD